MSLTPEDKQDVKQHLGKSLANKVSKVTRDGEYDYHHRNSINSRIELNRQASGGGDEGRVPHKYDTKSYGSINKGRTAEQLSNYKKDFPAKHKALSKKYGKDKSTGNYGYRGTTSKDYS